MHQRACLLAQGRGGKLQHSMRSCTWSSKCTGHECCTSMCDMSALLSLCESPRSHAAADMQELRHEREAAEAEQRGERARLMDQQRAADAELAEEAAYLKQQGVRCCCIACMSLSSL